MVYINTPTREYTSGPRQCPTEPDDVKFSNNREVEAYAEKNGLAILESPTRKRQRVGSTTYRYQVDLKEVMEVNLMRNVEGLAREVQEKHSEYSWVKCLRIAKKALQKKEKGNAKN